MKRLLYISTARSILSSTELDALLVKSRRANSAADITGLLVVGGRRFLQVLEGPDQNVTATYKRIAADPRHFALVKLHDREITTRAFASWAMGYEQGGVIAEAATLEEQIATLVGPIADPTLRAYFTGFVETHLTA
jgi:hypothetical protein